MRKTNVAAAFAAMAILASSCLSMSDSTANHTVYSLYIFTQSLLDLSVTGPVSVLNGMSDEELFGAESGQQSRIVQGLNATITHVQDSLWCIKTDAGQDMEYTTFATMLPETADILGTRLHMWNVTTEGTYKEKDYSADFKSMETILCSWKMTDNSWNANTSLLINSSNKGVFRMDTKLGTRALDYGLLIIDGNALTFESSCGEYRESDGSVYYDRL